MTNIPLTAILQDRDLTVVRPDRSGTSITLYETVNWVDNTASQMITSDGDYLIFNNQFTGNPIELQAVIQDRDLTVERH